MIQFPHVDSPFTVGISQPLTEEDARHWAGRINGVAPNRTPATPVRVCMTLAESARWGVALPMQRRILMDEAEAVAFFRSIPR